MRKVSITKQYTFEAAHQLPNHIGQCARLHGHSYLLEVTVSGPIKPEDGSSDEGMIMDFADMGVVVKKEVTEKFDHQFLNDLVGYVTTAENLAMDIFDRLESAGLPLLRVRLWETRKAYAEVSS
ncbi:MAG: 6-pyruvoyltetrahydropterin/6-carboxytetrahydropterin synthase [Planctomycetota bacterium]|jgi:6-pyruvoyltetrahydropterin/6-carboxytetrahydropterin synthase